jgi:hypothetical protein
MACGVITSEVILLAQGQHHKEGEKVMKKKSLAFVLAGILLCTLATPAFAKRHHKKHHHHHHHAQQAQH